MKRKTKTKRKRKRMREQSKSRTGQLSLTPASVYYIVSAVSSLHVSTCRATVASALRYSVSETTSYSIVAVGFTARFGIFPRQIQERLETGANLVNDTRIKK